MGFPRWLLQKHQPAFFDAKLEAKPDDFAEIVLSLCPGVPPEPVLSICYARLSSESQRPQITQPWTPKHIPLADKHFLQTAPLLVGFTAISS